QYHHSGGVLLLRPGADGYGPRSARRRALTVAASPTSPMHLLSSNWWIPGRRHTSDVYVDNDRHVIAQARAAPVFKCAEAQFCDLVDPLAGNKHVVDVIGRTVFLAISPVVGWRDLHAGHFGADSVVRADQSQALHDLNL